MKANSDKSKQSNKATRRVLAGVLCGASVLSLVLSLVMPPISQAIANDAQAASTEGTVTEDSSSESTEVGNINNGDTENQNSDETEGDASEDNVAADSTADGAEVKGAEQPSDNENSDENAIAPVSAEDYKEVKDDVADAFNSGGNYRLSGESWSDSQIKITANTTIDLNGNMLCNHSGGLDSFFVVEKGATLTIEDLSKKTNDVPRPVDTAKTPVGQLASMEWEKGSGSNNGTPKSLTYYETKSTPSTDEPGTTETTYEHVVTGFGAIVAASGSGSVKQVISVEEGCTLNLNGGMITTPGDLAGDGHIILAVGKSNETQVNINGGFITGANLNQQRGGWGGGLCVVGAKVTVNMTGGVIAANKAASGGGIYAEDAKLNLSDGVISGNATYSDSDGFGGGILASGGSVTVSGGYITNNKYAKFCGKDGDGCHGGAGLAAKNGTHVTISGGQITGNYSEEAGGGVYVTDVDRHGQSRSGMAWLNITGGIIASNVSFRSEGAGIRVGQMVDAMINAPKGNSVYITNNTCLSRFDWGGGGIFVQGDSKNASNAGRLFVYNSYISSNTAGGYGGGVAVCPSGKTLVTGTEGTAIFGNTDAGDASGYDNTNNKYDPSKNTGNDRSPHLSGGGDGKNQDYVAYAYNPPVFRTNGHADFFLAAHDHTEPIAAVIGKMLGGGDAKYSGSIELEKTITIPANGGVQVKNSIGLSSSVKTGDPAATAAQNAATTFITGNYSWDHGGGIMSNGDLYLGQPADTYVYPSLKLKASKALKNKKTEKNMALAEDQFSFSVYRKDSGDAKRPSWNDKTFSDGGCTLVGTAKNDASGNITFDLGEQFIDKTVEANKITYYLFEQAGGDSGIEYDHAVYEIEVQLTDNKTLLMKVPKKDDQNDSVELYVHNCTIASVSVTRHSEDPNSLLGEVQPGEDGYYSIGCSDGSKTFTNKYTPYTSSGSWKPMATKVVEGGEMKEFTLEFADNLDFTDAKTVKTKADDNKPQTLEFPEIEYKLGSLKQSDSEVPGRGSSKTFTYYVREKTDGSWFSHYKFDKSVYKITVTATDQSDKTIKCDVTYTKIVNADGKDIPENEQKAVTYVPVKDEAAGKEQSVPVFTNTYSTSLPLSGMSGVTLTYLAGAAVLCAAAAWMHIRRKANAKGGERRE